MFKRNNVMNPGHIRLGLPSLLMLILFSSPVMGRANFDPKTESGQKSAVLADPNLQYALHAVGNVGMTITNYGTIGIGYIPGPPLCGGEVCPSCEFPLDSEIEHLFTGIIWVGAIVGQDTLVSTGGDGWYGSMTELFPDSGESGSMIARSNNPDSPVYSPDALSSLEFLATYTDTVTDPALTGIDPYDNRPHIPLNIAIDQNSYSWESGEVGDFILFEYAVKNIGASSLDNAWIGIYIDGDVFHDAFGAFGFQDDICGFRRTAADQYDTVNVAWIADNDGDPDNGVWTSQSARSVIGFKMHEVQPKPDRFIFNWWLSNGNPALDFAPRMAGTAEDPFRPFNAHLGTPTGDRNKYYVLSHPEFDYDQLFTAISHSASGFLPPPPPANAADFADGYDTKFLYSFGPFDIVPGDSVVFYYSIVMGENFHDQPNDFSDHFDPLNPHVFYDRLDFSDLFVNVRVADSVYETFKLPVDVDDDIQSQRPNSYVLSDNYPNPFNPSTTIEYSLSRQSYVELSVFDLLGRKIKTLFKGNKPAGDYSVIWYGNDESGQPVATGVYLYRLTAGDFIQTKKMLLLK